MKSRKLRELNVSAIGLGCMGFSHGYGPAPERGESIRLIRRAFEMGCNFFDTAEVYGAGGNESIVGEALKPLRQQAILATKLHIPDNRDKSLKAVITAHLDASLQSSTDAGVEKKVAWMCRVRSSKAEQNHH